MVLLEVCAGSLSSALAAERGGAHRIELCSNLEVGGITPSYGLINVVKEKIKIPVHVLIRPRAGGFMYDGDELEIMKNDIEIAGRLNCEGVVIGVLTEEKRVDIIKTRALVDIAKRWNMSVTFHRAFDDTLADEEELERVLEVGCDRLLTSGGRSSAAQPEAIRKLQLLVKSSAGRLKIMPGAGVTPQNVAWIVGQVGSDEVHSSCKRVMHSKNQEESMFAVEKWETSEEVVKEMLGQLESINR